MIMSVQWALLLVVGAALIGTGSADDRPLLIKPSEKQIDFQRLELTTFHHFGPNTYTGREWGYGDEDPNLFQPIELNTTQWIEVVKKAGFKQAILVAKHHDGFMLYPSEFTNHSVVSSSWRDGKGDVVKDFQESCELLGVEAAYYLSPWDRNYFNMTWKESYNQYYQNTLEVLVSNYGEFHLLWIDGANAVPGVTGKYAWKSWYEVFNKSQPNALFGGCDDGKRMPFNCGPDNAWIGNEDGTAPEELWDVHQPSIQFPTSDGSLVYAPHFCDTSIRAGWFWHPQQKPKSLQTLVNFYFKSVGHNCVLQLNIPPNTAGLLDENDVHAVLEFGEYIRNMFSVNFALNAEVTASSSIAEKGIKNALDTDPDTYWEPEPLDEWIITVHFENGNDSPVGINVLQLQENIRGGQAVAGFLVEGIIHGQNYWSIIADGTTIGNKKLVRFRYLDLVAVRLTITKTLYNYPPQIATFGLHYAPDISTE